MIETDRPDAALLDVTLKQEKSFPVARVLDGESIPYIFITACSED